MSWESVRIGDVCEVTSSKRIFYDEYVPFGVPFWRSKEVILQEAGQTVDDPLFISEERYAELERFGYPEEGDLLVTSVGTIGSIYRVKGSDRFYFKDGNLTWLRKFDSKRVDSRFLMYLLRSAVGQGLINSTLIGSSQKALTISALKGITITLPEVEVQHRIASILMAYDDLIENNRRQIALLEEAAQRLYREWFVDLRFPGHESASIVNGVPNGWRNCGLNEIVTFHRGFDLPRKSIVDGPYPVVGSTSVIGYHNQFKVCGPGIVTGRSGTLGSHQLIWDDFWPHNTSLYISDYKRHHFLFVYAMISQLDFTLLGGGAAVPTLNRNVLSGFSVLEPSAELQDEFVRTTGPVFNKIRLLNHQVRYAQEARNRLLPKLMSGEIEVEG